MKKVYLYTQKYVCERRELDAKRIYDFLIRQDYEFVNSPKNADIIIYMTGASLDFIVEDALNKIKEFQKYDAELIVAGCLPAIEKEKLSQIFKGKTICTKDLENFDSLFPDDKIKFKDIEDTNVSFKNLNKITLFTVFGDIPILNRLYTPIANIIMKNIFGEYSVVYRRLAIYKMNLIRISWGCLGNCSYCGIKKAIGPHYSKPLDQCIYELKKGLKNGIKTFVITGDDSGAYGIDIDSSLPEFLDQFTRINEDYKVIFDSANPVWIVKYIDDLEKIFKRKKIVYISLPIQSANKRILKLMNRYSNIEKMKEAFLKIKKYMPEILLHTHFIVGFPTETEAEFRETLKFFTEVNFDSGFIYSFSCKTGTQAEKLEPKISEEEKSRRMKYAKKFLKKSGYKVISLSKLSDKNLYVYRLR